MADDEPDVSIVPTPAGTLRRFRPTKVRWEREPTRQLLEAQEVDDEDTDRLQEGETLEVTADVDWALGERLEILDEHWRVACHAVVVSGSRPTWRIRGTP
jgi:hypothetical protein